MEKYLPEGMLKAQDFAIQFSDRSFPVRAYEQHLYLEAKPVLCDSGHNLRFKLGDYEAVMPREECALGIADGTVRDIAIISRVNKPTGFYITGINGEADSKPVLTLSRVERQLECRENYISRLVSGDVVDARITRLEPFGAFCDIGAGIIALLPVDGISVSRIPEPSVRFSAGECIKAVVKSVDEEGRILLSHKELLGTWEENARRFAPGETVTGIVRSIENYGVFVELTPNLAGLAEFNAKARPGCSASVFIKSINPEKMKIKLIIVETDSEPAERMPTEYFISEGHISRWQYSPDCSYRMIASDFD